MTDPVGFLTATAPFAWTTDDGVCTLGADAELLNRRRVTQCALSRVCGVCADPLGRPVAFVGTEEEIGRNAFHAPPMHEPCARGIVAGAEGWEVVTTSGFEFHRPDRGDPDRHPRFEPNSLL